MASKQKQREAEIALRISSKNSAKTVDKIRVSRLYHECPLASMFDEAKAFVPEQIRLALSTELDKADSYMGGLQSHADNLNGSILGPQTP